MVPHFNEYNNLLLTYNSNNNVKANSKLLSESLKDHSDITVIGHSLGGILAVMLLDCGIDIKKIVTIASPFGGCESASFIRFIQPQNKSLADLDPYGFKIQEIKSVDITVPMLSFVTHGVPLVTGQDGDGVVSVKSQIHFPNAKYVQVHSNHFECLMNLDIVRNIKSFLKT